MVTQDKAFNAGCMLNDYTPQTLERLKIGNNTFRDKMEKYLKGRVDAVEHRV